MIFRDKISELQMQGYAALRIADFWQRKIAKDGEDNAEQFYRHLGLNHLEKKSFDFEGLTLSREPKEHEKIAVKGIAKAQESAKESIGKVLLTLRTELIQDGLKGIKKLKPATYHELILEASADSRQSLRDRLIKVHKQGRLLVAAELSHAKAINHPLKMHEWAYNPPFFCTYCGLIPDTKAAAEDEFDDLDELTDLTISRVINDTQARVIASALEWALLGLSGVALLGSVRSDIDAGSVSYIDRAAGGLSNRVIGIGRRNEMRDRSDSIDHFEYSSILDLNTCPACASLDGTTAQSMEDLPEVPLSDCDGGSMCRCFIVAITL